MPVVLHTNTVFWTRLLSVVFSCLTISVAVYGGRLFHSTGNWCIFCWGFSFSGTLLILLVELFGLQTRSPVSWRNFPITFACYALLLCLSASIIFPLYFLRGAGAYWGETFACRIACAISSCLTTIMYMIEVRVSKARPGEKAGYMATAPGLLKVFETFLACIIFMFISEPPIYESFETLQYCLAVYCICFILSAVIILLSIGKCTDRLPFSFDRFVSGYSWMAMVLYLSATIIWPIFNFDPWNGGEESRPANCGSDVGLCTWDKRVAVAVLTAVNFILYLADLICTRSGAAVD